MSLSTDSFTVLLGNAANDPSFVSSETAVSVSSQGDLAAARKGLTASSLDHLEMVVNAMDIAEMYNPMELANWVVYLRAGATASIRVLNLTSDGKLLQPIHSSLLLAGLAGVSERKEAAGTICVITATRKQQSDNRAVPLPKKTTAVVSIAMTDDFDDDIIDEDGLLSEDLLAPPKMQATTATEDDCGGRTACDNCTCGRAEQEAGQKAAAAAAPKSSCGKCGLGDAFRCASCPYLGMPAFKPGEEQLILDLQDDL